MRVAVIADQHDGEEGFVGERLRMHGAHLHKFWRDDASALGGAIDHSDLLVLLGSDRSVYDGAQRGVVDAERAVVRGAEERGIPVLAICYGAQLVASSLGAPVTPAARPEIGWVTLDTNDEDLCPTGPWFQFHFDCWGEIPGVGLLARSEHAPQAFVQRRTLAVQFHPEVTSETARHWMRAAARHLDRLGFDVDALEAETLRLEAAARLRCHRLVDSFLSEVAGRTQLDVR